MRSGAFAHDPHSVLAGIQPLAFVRDELFLDVGVCILRSADSLRICRELGIATITNAKHRDIIPPSDDPKLAFILEPLHCERRGARFACAQSFGFIDCARQE